jgi:hypothetical protein
MSRSARGEVVIEIREAYDRVFSDASVAKEFNVMINRIDRIK